MTHPHVLVIVQNLPVPLDRRVWLECRALTEAGYEVSVICPKGEGDPAYQLLDGVHIYKYAPPPQAAGPAGYLLEFVYCWFRTAWLSRKVWRRRPFSVMQACNPPDTYWALARLWRLRGVRFVFDHHDLNPEVYRSRFGEAKRLSSRTQLAGLYWLEKRTFRAAHRVISTNESYRRIAIERGGVRRQHTAVVRSGPDTTTMRPGEEKPDLRRGRKHLVVWLGIMGPQDGVDDVLDITRRVVREHGREDVTFAILGFGDCLEDLRRDCTRLDLDDYVALPGRVGPEQIRDYFSTASAGISPDPKNPLNDVSTMNKTMEYLAYGLPVVAYRLAENAISAGECAVHVDPGDAEGFTAELLALLDDTDRRAELGKAGRLRAERELDWAPQAKAYVSVYDDLIH
jgi:glycosyltransferase involved in cell wall biosynthesis